jgi:methylenetetrahydrofolate reductase (NADPH)
MRLSSSYYSAYLITATPRHIQPLHCVKQVPASILEALEPIKHDDEAVKAYGIALGTEMCSTLVSNGTPGLHFYTLNLERSVLCILESGGYSSGAALRRQYPWRASTEAKRAGKH